MGIKFKSKEKSLKKEEMVEKNTIQKKRNTLILVNISLVFGLIILIWVNEWIKFSTFLSSGTPEILLKWCTPLFFTIIIFFILLIGAKLHQLFVQERKKTEENLKKSRQEFASLFKNSPEALVYTDEKGNVLDMNPCFSALFGYTLDEIKGINIDDGMITAPDKMKEAKKLTNKALKEDFYFETVRKKKNGTRFPVAISGSRVIIGGRFKGFITSYLDITERQKMIDDLKNSEEKYRSLYENMPGAYYRADKDGNLIMINPEGAKLFGYNSSEDILGKNISQHLYFAPEDRKKYLKELEKNKGNLKDFELTIKKKDGSPLVISDTSNYYYDKEGNIAGVEGIFVDISERKQAEKFQKVLYNISKAANSPISLKQLYKTIHQELGTIIDTSNFHIALLNKEENRIHYDYFFDEKDNISVTLEYNNTGSLSAHVIKTVQPLLVNRKQINKMIERGELILSHLGTLTEETLWLRSSLKDRGQSNWNNGCLKLY